MKNFSWLLIGFCLISFKTEKKITWVAIGDSITYLNEHLNETGNRVTKGYLTMVIEKLPNVRYINQGHNGWTSAGLAKEIENIGLVKADVYTILLGTNDWWQGRPVGTLADYKNSTGVNTMYGSFRIIINKLHELNKNAKIILITPLQRSDFVYLNDLKNNAYGSYKEKNGQSLAKFAEALKTIAKYEHISVMDLYTISGINQHNLIKYKRLKDPETGTYKNYIYPLFINVPFNASTDDYPYPPEAMYMTYDGLHPSDKGNAVIANMLVKILKKELAN